jgi:hypothetical protein
VLVSKPGMARLAGGHEAHRAAQAATFELIAHAMLLSARGRACPLPILTVSTRWSCGGHPGSIG